MADLVDLDRAHHATMLRVVTSAAAPHYTELARVLDTSLDTARELTHELVATIPGWVHPDTDNVASFPPFNLMPTHYKVTIDGDEGWFAQCGLEALAVRWVVPGQAVRVDAPCLCCGEPIVVEMLDEQITTVEPLTTVGYSHSKVGGPAEGRPFR